MHPSPDPAERPDAETGAASGVQTTRGGDIGGSSLAVAAQNAVAGAVFPAFQQLGDEIEARWSALDYAEEVFPELAADALRRADLPAQLHLGAVLQAALASPRLAVQRDLPSRFGEPALTLYDGSRFYIDVYVWFSSTTALHQHAFAGAFQVLAGSSLHGHYTFTTRREINPYFRLGELALRRCEVFERGAVQPIVPGSAYIHRLFHLDHPSATIVVRTAGSPAHQPQFSYDPPSVAYDPFFDEATTTKKLQCLGALLRSGAAEADEAIGSWLARADLHSAFLILSAARRWLARGDVARLFAGSGLAPGGDDRFARLLAATRQRNGAVVDELALAFDEQARIDHLVAQRGHLSDPELRFFLALLLNVEQREAILAMVASRYPDTAPRDKVLEWIRALARTRTYGGSSATALGIDGFDDYDLLILEQLLAGGSDEAVAAALAPPGAAAARDGEWRVRLESRLVKLRSARVLAPLLQTSA